jgi:single-stranded-DNA-specific exonuclease
MIRQTDINVGELSKQTGLNRIIVRLLINRGITTSEQISKFINVSPDDFYDPALMKDMNKGIKIILDAVNRGDKIAVYGDYDADGVMSTVILFKALKELGADVIYHIPDREYEGYGMNNEAVEDLRKLGINVILTCDTGIASTQQISLAKKLGMSVVVTDHHEIPFTTNEKGERISILPCADAIINPKQDDCKYPFKNLCSAGISYKFAELLFRESNTDNSILNEFLEYVAVATVCDVVDLVDENRIFVKEGIKNMQDTRSFGLKALIEETGLTDKCIDTYHIGFILGPCINASGRLEQASYAVEIFLADEYSVAKKLACILVSLNNERKAMTDESVEKAVSIIEMTEIKEDKILVVYDETIHESIAGIVAGRIKEKYNLPTIILTQGLKMSKGSARSVEKYNIFEELSKCKDLLNNFGGHPMAAGLSLEKKNISILRKTLNDNCELNKEDFEPVIRIDMTLPAKDIDMNLAESIEILEPFGKENPTPIFGEKGVTVVKTTCIGVNKNVLRFLLKFKNQNNTINAIYFNGVDKFKSLVESKYGQDCYNDIIRGGSDIIKMDILYSITINEFRGDRSVQLRIKDIRI